MLIFNLLFGAGISAVIGGLFTNSKGENAVPRAVSLTACFVVLALQIPDLISLAAWCWIFYVVRLIPTNTMLSAVNGNAPAREDSWKWQWMQDLTINIDHVLVKRNMSSWHIYGIIYGFIRASLSIPAIIIIGNPWLLLFLLQGVLYYAAGVFQRRFYPMRDIAPRIAEVISGALFGLLISL